MEKREGGAGAHHQPVLKKGPRLLIKQVHSLLHTHPSVQTKIPAHSYTLSQQNSKWQTVPSFYSSSLSFLLQLTQILIGNM